MRRLLEAAAARAAPGARGVADARAGGGNDGGDDGAAAAGAAALRRNLRVLVLDEADQLLKSADVARQAAARAAQRDDNNGAPLTRRQREVVRKIRGAATPCEEALRALPAAGCAKGLGDLQLVCATATAGRALRRQLQELSGAPNIEAAAQLVAADAKRPALLPRTLRNAYVLWRPPRCAGGGAAEAADAEPVDEAAAVAEAAVAELGRAVQAALPAAAAILFAPRALGVAKTAEALRRAGFGAAEVLPADGATAVAAVAAAEAAAAEGGWAAAPIFVASERWGRGLDLGVGYVFLLAPPANAAAYMHLAGRTARCGADGLALTLVTHQQAPRVAAFGERRGRRGLARLM